jgi:thymidylate kinase
VRHLIIDGPDGAGKTTLAKRHALIAGMEYHHEGPPPPEGVFEHYLRQVQRRRLTVFDRSFLGEQVYGPILRGGSALTVPQFNELLYEAKMGARIVVCLPPLEVAFRNWLSRAVNGAELIRREETFRLTYEAWRRLAADAGADLVYDYTKEAA